MTRKPHHNESARDVPFERLYTAHHRAILTYCARRVPRWDAWDAAAEVFVVAWRRLDEVPPGNEARAWLLGVAFRVLANQRRGESRRTRLLQRVSQVTAWTPMQEKVLGWTHVLDACVEDEPGQVRCPYSIANHLTRTLGFGPYPGSLFQFTIEDGKITKVTNEEADQEFQSETLDAFMTWMEENHPDDVDRMYYQYTDSPTLELWKEYVPEFVASVTSSG